MPDSPEPINRDWIDAELRSLRDIVTAEQQRVNERFAQVNELREQVLLERGVYVRHEALEVLSSRLARLEQNYINRAEHDVLTGRVFQVEKAGITRTEFDAQSSRVGKLEALGPLVALIATIIGGVIVYVITRWS